MSLFSNKPGFNPRIELKSKKCIDTVLRPLSDHVTIKINGPLTSEDIFRTVISMSVNRHSVHSVTARYQDVACENSVTGCVFCVTKFHVTLKSNCGRLPHPKQAVRQLLVVIKSDINKANKTFKSKKKESFYYQK